MKQPGEVEVKEGYRGSKWFSLIAIAAFKFLDAFSPWINDAEAFV